MAQNPTQPPARPTLPGYPELAMASQGKESSHQVYSAFHSALMRYNCTWGRALGGQLANASVSVPESTSRIKSDYDMTLKVTSQ